MDDMRYILSKIISEEFLTPSVPLIYVKNVEPGHKFGPHEHDSIEVITVLFGSSYMVINDECIKIKENECFIIFPNISHRFFLKNNQRCRILNLHFTPGDISTFFDIPNLKDDLRFFYELKTHTMSYLRVVDNSFIRFISERIYEEVENKNEVSDISMKLHFCELYIQLSKTIKDRHHIFRKPLNKYIDSALEYIWNFYNDKITLEQIAKHVQISPRQLTRLFSDELQTTINEYITDLRIKKSKEILKNTNMSITQVAHMLGFNSSEYFTTCFKKVEAITPKKYRQLMNDQILNNFNHDIS